MAGFVHNWLKLTGDPWVVSTVLGADVPLWGVPIQSRIPFPYRLASWERPILGDEVLKLWRKGVIEETFPEEGQFISNVFLRPKQNGEFRMILDLTEFNKWVPYEHFKMTSLQTAIQMLRPHCWMGSVDLKDAYYSVPMRQEVRKFLKFTWEGKLFQFVGMPNGLSCAPRIFTKLLVPVYADLRQKGVECFPYIDDSFVVADSEEACRSSLVELSHTLDDLGLVVHEGKSVLEPTQKLVFLGFELDSKRMVVSLTREKKEKFRRAAADLREQSDPSIREVAGLIGLMIAYAPAVEYGGAHVKWLEWDKNKALELAKGNFDGRMQVSGRALKEIDWWLHNLDNDRLVRLDSPEFEICMDASLEGWGAHRDRVEVGGRWLPEEAVLHINVLELKAILFGLQSLCTEKDVHVRVLTDNTTALAYVKNMGGVRSEPCNQVAKEIWDWCEVQGIWVTIAHIPGVENVVADYKSRVFEDNLEWTLNEKIFKKICKVFGTPSVDLFASRVNKKCDKFVSYRPEPLAWRVDAFSFEWSNDFFFIFPPFSLVSRVLQKVVADNTRALLVVPQWPSQPWFGRLKRLSRRVLTFRGGKGNLLNAGRPENSEVVNKCPLGVYLL